MKIQYHVTGIDRTQDGFEVEWLRNGQLRKNIRVIGEVIDFDVFKEILNGITEGDGRTWQVFNAEQLEAFRQTFMNLGKPEWFSGAMSL